MRQSFLLLSICCLFAGCSQPADSGNAKSGSPAPSSTQSTSPVPTKSAEPTDAVATVLGQPVKRSDCRSPSLGIESEEVGIYALVFRLLMDDFSKSQSVTLSQEEIDAFWKGLRAGAQRANPGQPAPEPVFDEAAVRGRLKQAQDNLAAADLPLLERLTLKAQIAGLERALELKSPAAMAAYEHLLPLRLEAALYKKYGGKVVARQISLQAAGAMHKLAEEAQDSGKLVFHDEALKQAFWKRLNDDLAHTEVPPERVDFSLPAWMQGLAQLPPGAAATTSAPALAAGDPGMHESFAGVWHTTSTMKPCQWFPDGANFTVREVTEPVMNGKYLLGREISTPDGEERLWIMTYDAKQKTYPFWMFNSTGLMGGQWLLTWDAATSTATGRATDTPAGWTSLATNRFPDGNTNIVDVWMKDENGKLLLDSHAEKVRQPAEAAAAILADWSKSEPSAERPAELQVLEGLVGTWDAVVISKPAVWTPKETKTTATWQREWILNGRFLLATRTVGNETSQLSLFSYDPQSRDYRYWSFTPDGSPSQARGGWSAAEQSFVFQSEPRDGKTMTMSARLVSDDQHEWQLSVLDDDGTKYLDMAVTTTRKK
uniref:Uncharacterized protein n=1 Tax=Schlesneria paludicola TaxID=360056 RepID=A0A7C2K138_9PLAN